MSRTGAQLKAGSPRDRLERLGFGKAKRTEYAGHIYASRAEAEHAQRLNLELRAGRLMSWEPQRRIPIVLNGLLVCTWVPDFAVRALDGKLEAHEVKGYLDDRRDWPIKAKAALALGLVDRVRVFRSGKEIEAPRPTPAKPPSTLRPRRSAATPPATAS